ncbi:MAG: hypothetical protein H6822_33215 [Planctomycetaceae bacterium]|nr:hypothetical protein [Planctomycetales bacterium]MCB9927047.1 hypothetical protein [Planctomycetaceae bacterium]
MSRRKPQSAEAPGQDSFLDIVANLVGILIILVMVIGVRAKDAMLEAAPVVAAEEATTEAQSEVAAAREVAKAVERDIQQLTSKINQEAFEIEYRRKERDKMQLLLAAAEQALVDKRKELSIEQQQELDSQRQLHVARSELNELERSVQAAEGSIPKTAIIEHLPTPMAKTVFGKEIHFQLADGKITYVPWDELVEKLQEEARQKLWRLKDAPQITETIGPIGGFLMRYQLKKTQQSVTTRAGTAIQQRVELDNFVLIPVDETLGEPVSESFLDGSKLHSMLLKNDPNKSTITIWTYPDSFNEFRELKQELFSRGYLTASRPMPAGVPIGGSPRGTRSAAQ